MKNNILNETIARVIRKVLKEHYWPEDTCAWDTSPSGYKKIITNNPNIPNVDIKTLAMSALRALQDRRYDSVEELLHKIYLSSL